MYVSTQAALNAFCERASSSRMVCLDTEFLREKTLFPQLCLLQMSLSADDIVAVDPLADIDLTPVSQLMANERVVKVVHSCSQDLEAIDHTLGVIPRPVFDTQVASAFLGYRIQVGYGALVEGECGVRLAKSESLTDWTRRPLDPEQIAYAEDDVRYLPQIYDKMMAELVRLNRLSWVMPEMEELTRAEHVRQDPETAYLHLKRVSALTRRQLGVAREVCAWREAEAAARDLPRKWVLSDELALEVCKRMPQSRERLMRIRGAERIKGSDAEGLLAAVRRGTACEPSALPKLPRRARPTADTEGMVDLMYAMLRVISERSGVAVQLIATRDELLDFAKRGSGSPLSQGWRHELAGRSLRRLLDGEVGLTVKDGRVEML